MVDAPWADGYVNPVYLGEGEIMQPSAEAFITPHDARYALVPRYVPRLLPTSPEPRPSRDVEVPKQSPKPKPKSSAHRKVI